MDKHVTKRAGRERRRRRVRKKVVGTPARPRLCVYRANANIYAQVIDDVSRRTLAAASTLDSEVKKVNVKPSNAEAAKLVGELVAKRAISAGIKEVVFDRSGNLYHGRVRALAEGARQAGLGF